MKANTDNLMITNQNIDQVISLLFDNFEFVSRIQDVVAIDKLNHISKINKSRTISGVVEQLYEDISRIIQFNLNEVTLNQFQELINQVINLKKQTLALNINLNNRINILDMKLEDIQKQQQSLRSIKQTSKIEQRMKDKIQSRKSIFEKLKQNVKLDDIQLNIDSNLSSRTKSSQTINNQFQFQQFTRSLKKSNELRFQNIWKAIMEIKQKICSQTDSNNIYNLQKQRDNSNIESQQVCKEYLLDLIT